ncbi:BMP family ABC transporter substrate-binding protein [Vibrio fluvialis]|uniref:BMP family lipoprotein n=1 Tax=Vibrio sp. bablab_jr001 TaxID=2755067 RepID=UPI0018F1AA18|nr:BMP family ABC transporter substrate-binding protein [Vibrio fluvialis]EKO3472921.1 BMP family ABC transporter substrate-binding protein [Vibrio fluvialis]MBY7943646.1 BMP family ABC transporter substrate-binding protein [Vibrio fluvialis]MBY8115621.1 BMP family ABC transporter substrate-binding protein [Vibrio fluvialis]MBY8248640.1 BMP family ABC transporter substrate-binding protein [Vibrio fluvialis]
MKKSILKISTLALAISSFHVFAEAKPAVIYDTAGKFDKSFNEAVYQNGVKVMEAEGLEVREFEPQNEAQREQGLRRLASRGFSPIVAVGFNMASAVEKVATEFPDIHFTILDMVVDKPNVQSIVFKEHEGSFLVGALAAKASKSGVVGFVGGMDIPLIRKFECGYEQGAKYANPQITVLQNMTGSTPAAFADPAKGSELAKSQFSKGADVIYAAAGGTGLGVYQAAADAGKLAIGVDSNQNHLQPGTMLTSMVKLVGAAAVDSWKEEINGTWQPGIKVLGLKENAVDWAYDEYNKPLISDEMKSYMESLKADIIAGKIQVHDYMSDNKCDY